MTTSCHFAVEDLRAAFHFLADEERLKICPFLRYQEWDKGHILMKEDDLADYMVFVISGKLAIKKQTAFPGKFTLVGMLEEGAMAGEATVLDRGRRVATVEVVEKCRLFVLRSDDFDKLLEVQPTLGITIIRRMLHVVGIRLRKAGERLAQLL
ncbi:MAG: cyclic nucleotide-binding domain-containing protein [Thermodesulfobacteriota bacterium]